jgi:carbamoyl-phosphate synthase/aspartate carbamoyltransferase/dihydroorotase
MYLNPKRIFNIPDQKNTYIEVDLDEEWVIPEAMPFSKARWTPFNGKKVFGRVRRVVLRNEVVFVDGRVLVSAGFGRNIFHTELSSAQTSTENTIGFDLLDSNISEEKTLEGNNRRIQQTTELYSEMFQELGIPSQSQLKPLSVVLSSPSTIKLTAALSPVPISSGHHSLYGQHILSVEDFNREQLHDLFNLAHKMRLCVVNDRPLERDNNQTIHLNDILKGKVMASIFYEVSTRTSCSFAAAMQRLGGSVIYLNEEFSSVKKGESLEDSVYVLSNYSDVVVLRHPEKGAVYRVANSRKWTKPIINAGDGVGEHPTQALLDVFTIREVIGTVNNLVVRYCLLNLKILFINKNMWFR